MANIVCFRGFEGVGSIGGWAWVVGLWSCGVEGYVLNGKGMSSGAFWRDCCGIGVTEGSNDELVMLTFSTLL